MGHKDNRRLISDTSQRRFDVVNAAVAETAIAAAVAASAVIRPLIAKAGEPETVTVLFETDGMVLIKRDAGRFERNADGRRAGFPALDSMIFPPIMIAEDGVHAKRRLKARKRSGPGGLGLGVASETV